jgi:hypothetical protein
MVHEDKDIWDQSTGVDGLELRCGFLDVARDPIESRIASRTTREFSRLRLWRVRSM